MASKHHSLNLSELGDVTDVLVAFEEHNNVRIHLVTETVYTSKGPDLAVGAYAWDRVAEEPGARCLASVSVRCSAMNLRAWNAVLTRVLYMLDGQLAKNEFAATEVNKA